jgi:hypothetical protein
LGIADALHAESIRVRDAYDRIVTLRAPPQRIIPVYSSNVELVAALGPADRIVGIEAFTRYPPEILNRTRIGGRLGISVDATVALEPDLVIVTPGRQAVFQLRKAPLTWPSDRPARKGYIRAHSRQFRLGGTRRGNAVAGASRLNSSAARRNGRCTNQPCCFAAIQYSALLCGNRQEGIGA